jgi:CelD/BcsL family acetyltransferase involved in cellulose biosynthesis
MGVALPLDGNQVEATVSKTGPDALIAAVEIEHDLRASEPVWRRLESEGALTTPYQSYEFLSAWQRHVGQRSSVTPLVVTAYDAAGRPILLWPLGRTDHGPFRVARYLGGKHASINFGLWQPDFAPSVTADDLAFVIKQIAAAGDGVDLIALHRQPRRWNGLANPLLLLPHQASPSDSCGRSLTRSDEGAANARVSRSLRRQLRSKDRALGRLPGYRYFQASTPEEVDRLLGWFFPVKARHLAAQGLANAFAEPGVEDFVRDICRRKLAEGEPLAELHAIEAEGELLAVFTGTGDDRRFSAMFNTYTTGPLARHSPGLVLLNHMIANLGDRGFTSLDLGVGDARYKRSFCREVEPLFDSFLPLTAKGHLAAICASGSTAIKRGIKRTPRLFSALQSLRRHLNFRPK